MSAVVHGVERARLHVCSGALAQQWCTGPVERVCLSIGRHVCGDVWASCTDVPKLSKSMGAVLGA